MKTRSYAIGMIKEAIFIIVVTTIVCSLFVSLGFFLGLFYERRTWMNRLMTSEIRAVRQKPENNNCDIIYLKDRKW